MDIAHALKLQCVAATFLHGALPDHKYREIHYNIGQQKNGG